MAFTMNRMKIAAAELIGSGDKRNLEEVARCLWGGKDLTDRQLKEKVRQLKNWMKEPLFQDYYKRNHFANGMHVYSHAFKVMTKQVDSSDGWLAQNAARDLLNRLEPAVIGKDEQNIHIVVEGMPELGEPGDEE